MTVVAPEPTTALAGLTALIVGTGAMMLKLSELDVSEIGEGSIT
jgi:hypothetical protein